ncbi:hypothetical protein [Paraburkholderia caffeinilytica]|nr:hypothetical protein [Paraburkholderia caffeinilytica]CAB3804844.1 hypothetical protein LMG28690_06097 [Paraburkholderia caffeinilytica]
MARLHSNNQRILPIWAIWIIAALASFALAAINPDSDIASAARPLSAHHI